MKRLLLSVLIAVVVLAASAFTSTGPTLAASVAGDSVRVVATWRPGCDGLGCGDTSRVVWEVGGQTRPARLTTARRDTLWLALPAWRDSTVVVVRVATIRRGLVSTAQAETLVVHRLDAPPPPPDSLRVDTVALRIELEDEAFRDSFPVGLLRDTLGRRGGDIAAGDTIPLCLFSRNRYTGKVWTMVPDGITEAEQDRREQMCERARQLVESERDT